MLHKTRGIVFRFTRYGDTSIIVNVFTELFGLQTYIVNGVRSSSARGKIALYQPLMLLDLVVYYKENAAIKRIKEVRCMHPYQTLHTDVKKSAVAIFLNEVLNKTVKDESHAAELYRFIAESLMHLDDPNRSYENFHLVFLVKLSQLLGFGANSAADVLSEKIFDPQLRMKLENILQAEYQTPLKLTNTQRREILEMLLAFYKDHIDTIGEFKSVRVLKELLH